MEIFLGSLFFEDKDFAIPLLENGLATLNSSAKRLKNFEKYQSAEDNARKQKKNLDSIQKPIVINHMNNNNEDSNIEKRKYNYVNKSN